MTPTDDRRLRREAADDAAFELERRREREDDYTPDADLGRPRIPRDHAGGIDVDELERQRARARVLELRVAVGLPGSELEDLAVRYAFTASQARANRARRDAHDRARRRRVNVTWATAGMILALVLAEVLFGGGGPLGSFVGAR